MEKYSQLSCDSSSKVIKWCLEGSINHVNNGDSAVSNVKILQLWGKIKKQLNWLTKGGKHAAFN